MIAWRLTTVSALDGKGGLKAPGRWHTRGRRIIYASENPEGTLLEVIVHLRINLSEIPSNYRLLSIEIPDDIEPRGVRMRAGWERDPSQSRAKGDAWLKAGETALLRVPSVIMPAAHNILINPAHIDAKRIRTRSDEPFQFDSRLL